MDTLLYNAHHNRGSQSWLFEQQGPSRRIQEMLLYYLMHQIYFPLGQSISDNKPGPSSIVAPNISTLLCDRANHKVRIPITVITSIGVNNSLYGKSSIGKSYRELKSRTTYIHSPLVTSLWSKQKSQYLLQNPLDPCS